MYLDFFGMSNSPFPTVAVSENYFGFHGIQQSLDSLKSAICRNAGPCLIVGPAGTGKSILLDVLKKQNQLDQLSVCLSSTRLCTRRSLLQSLLFEVGLDYHAKDEGELRLALTEFLRNSASCQNGFILLVDEAHTLPMHLLDELRVLTNVVRNGKNLLQLVLAGSSRLEENLSEPSMDSFNQRIACRVYLSGIGREELAKYVRYQLDRVGCQIQDLFDSEAIKSIHIATNGIPRLVNQLCEFALVFAAEKKVKRIDADLVQWAWSTMQQIPVFQETKAADSKSNLTSFGTSSNDAKTNRGTATPGKTISGNIIEFGELDDDCLPATSNSIDSDSKICTNPTAAATTEPASESKSDVPATTTRPAVITFAFEQDIQRPSKAQKTSDLRQSETEPVAFATAKSKQVDIVKQSDNDSKPSVQKVSTGFESDIPALNAQQTVNRINSTMEIVNHALNSLDDDWSTVEQVLAEAELEAVVRPVVSDPQRNFPALSGSKNTKSQIKSSQIKPLVDPKSIFEDHLFDELENISDTQWGYYLTPDSEPDFSLRMAEADYEPKSELNSFEDSETLPVQSMVPHPPTDTTENLRSTRNPKDDDRRIIHQTVEDEFAIQHSAHTAINPPAARRKDLRALLTALRGY